MTEVKFTTKGEAIDEDRVSSSTRTLDDGTEVDQMEHDWIETSFQEDIAEESLDITGEYQALDDAITFENYRKESIVVQDGMSGATIDADLTDLDMDRITTVRTAGVTQ